MQVLINNNYKRKNPVLGRNSNIFIVITLLVLGCSAFGALEYIGIKILMPILIICTIYEVFQIKYFLQRELLLFYLFCFLSALSSFHFRNQTILETFRTMDYMNFSMFAAYFVFVKYPVGIAKMEKILYYAFLIFIFIYIIQYSVYPRRLVLLLAENTGEERFRLMGQVINSLGYFFCLNKYLLGGKAKYLFLSLLSILIFFMLGFRMMLAALLLVSFILVCIIKSFSIITIVKVMASVAFSSVLLFSVPAVQKGFDRMLKATQEGSEYTNEDYARIIEWNYFMNDHFKSPSERIFGSGIPSGKSLYGKEMYVDHTNYSSTIKYGYVDWGFLGYSWVLGPLPIIILLLIYIKGIVTSYKAGRRYLYISAWFSFMILISINNVEPIRFGSIIFESAVFYVLYELCHLKRKRQMLKFNEIN